MLGTNIGELLKRETSSLTKLSGKALAIDALNAIYQFLAIIRLPNGTLLRDRRGRATSHLMGLFYRTINFLEHGIKPIYVFDGRPPRLKEKTLEERRLIKEKFSREWREALEQGDMVKAFKKSVMTAHVDDVIISESKELLTLMGVPWVQAPSEGEAQAAYMASRGDVWASASQDYDSLLFGAPRLVRNLTIAGKKYYPKKGIVEDLIPEVIRLDEVLSSLGITREQLIDVAMLVGTDYNEGVKGIGPKTALKLIKRYGSIEEVVRARRIELGFDPEEVRRIFLNPEVSDQYELIWGEPEYAGIREFMLERDFSAERVDRGLERLRKAVERWRSESLIRWIS